MKKLLSLFLLVVLALNAVAQDSYPALLECEMKSEILGTVKKYCIYLPAGYGDENKEFPVLYLLHGLTDTHTAWRDKGNTQAIATEVFGSGKAQEMVIVMPDAGTVYDGYFNAGEWRYEDYFFQELVPHIEKEYRVVADKGHRAIAGLSMGGGGAVVYSQRHPDMFSACYSTSGLLDIRYHPKNPDVYEASYLWSVTHTSPVEFLRTASDEQIAALRTVRWMADCGDDDAIIKTNLEFFIEMMREEVKMEFRVRDGNHNWKFWRVSLPEILKFVFKKE